MIIYNLDNWDEDSESIMDKDIDASIAIQEKNCSRLQGLANLNAEQSLDAQKFGAMIGGKGMFAAEKIPAGSMSFACPVDIVAKNEQKTREEKLGYLKKLLKKNNVAQKADDAHFAWLLGG